jgi:hypothetical protein
MKVLIAVIPSSPVEAVINLAAVFAIVSKIVVPTVRFLAGL